MPAKSKAQQRLMAAAEHGAMFPKAKALRQSMTLKQLADFAQSKPTQEKVPARDTGVKHAPAKKMNAGRKPGSAHPHQNLGQYLHPKKGW